MFIQSDSVHTGKAYNGTTGLSLQVRRQTEGGDPFKVIIVCVCLFFAFVKDIVSVPCRQSGRQGGGCQLLQGVRRECQKARVAIQTLAGKLGTCWLEYRSDGQLLVHPSVPIPIPKASLLSAPLQHCLNTCPSNPWLRCKHPRSGDVDF